MKIAEEMLTLNDGRTPKAFKLKDGTYIDEDNMILFLCFKHEDRRFL